MAENPNLPQEIGKDLVLRRSIKTDADRLGKFYNTIFKLPDGTPEMDFIPWVRDLLSGSHPMFEEGDFTIIEDTSKGQIVSAMNLISQTWTFGGIPINVGRPEAVATDPAYRNQGLVRRQFDVVHAWSRQRGQLLQGITGIPYYYRLFGYEMCIEMEGGRMGYGDSLPLLTENQKDSYRIRAAQEKDLPFIAQLYSRRCEQLLMVCPRDEKLWRYELFGHDPKNEERMIILVIESSTGELLGYFMHLPVLGPEYQDENGISCYGFELKPGISYLDVAPVVLHYLWKIGQSYAQKKNKKCSSIGLWLEESHPAMSVVTGSLPKRRLPYAWYIRVPNLPEFIKKVTPVLENRLETSSCAGYSGDLNLTFYNSKLKLAFSKGKIQDVALENMRGEEGCQAAFPGQTFYHLLFGYRTLIEVEYMFPDCWAKDDVRPLLDALFPPVPSNIWPIS